MFGRKSPGTPPRDPLIGKPGSYGIHRYLQGASNLFEENRLLKLAVIGLFGITAVLGTVIYTSNQNTRTIIVPYGAGGDLYVTGGEPSEAYLRSITRNVVSLSGTYSAYSADRQFQELLSITHPSTYNSLRDAGQSLPAPQLHAGRGAASDHRRDGGRLCDPRGGIGPGGERRPVGHGP